MVWERERFEDRRGGEKYRPPSRGHSRHVRSPPPSRSPRLVDTWMPPGNRIPDRTRSRSPGIGRRSRSPSFWRGTETSYRGRFNGPPRRFSPGREERRRSPQNFRSRRSSLGEDRSHEAFRGRESPTWRRDHPPPRRGSRYFQPRYRGNSWRGRFAGDRSFERRSPSRDRFPAPTFSRSRSPFQSDNRGGFSEGSQRPSVSPPKRSSPVHTSPRASVAPSRPSSPSNSNEWTKISPPSPNRSPPGQSTSKLHPSSHPVNAWEEITQEVLTPAQDRDSQPPTESTPAKPATDVVEQSEERQRSHVKDTPSILDAPTQPKNFNVSQPSRNPPPAPFHGPKSSMPVDRGSNISLLSAPTRPRHKSTFREAHWTGPASGLRPTHGSPSGPRGSIAAVQPPGEPLRRYPQRSHTVANSSYHRAPRTSSHLLGLSTVIPGGKLLPRGLGSVAEKRLAQLELDRERLLQQVAETQEGRRKGLREWERMDRENTLSVLRSELAEGHLQRMAEGDGSEVGPAF